MPTRRSLVFSFIALGLASSLIGAGGCLAAPEREAPESQTPSSDAAPLRGPSVEDRHVPGAGGLMTADDQMTDRARREAEHPVPYVKFMELIYTLRRPVQDTQRELRLDTEQYKQVRALDVAHRKAMMDYRRAHRAQVQLAMEESRTRAETVDRLRKLEGPERKLATIVQDANTADVREKIRELRDGAPDAQVVQAKMWAVLTPPQRAWMERRIVLWREVQIEESVRRRVAQAQDAAEAPPADDAATRGGSAPPSRARNRYEQIRNMSDEEKRALRERMQREIERREAEEAKKRDEDDSDGG